ncbi:Fc receptor-like protein 4 isoform X18 [Corvus moneduloides]|uniref:Fc receptor-like protein 4 isoform X18 n=1 Tax=Corvus moneduloides TaxID=1196302 RepID=UPI0013636D7B|nr:Fc receptor-like protein 4 isoform X18 [Corvus moneduloides]
MAGKVALLLWAQTLGLTGAQTTQLLVQPPWTPPVLWDRVTLTCQGSGTAAATTWYKDGQRWRLQGPDRFVVTESGTYQCDRPGTGHSPPVSVSNGVPLSGVSVSAQPPGGQVALGDRLVLSCAVAAGTGPLSFSWHRGDSWALLGTGPPLELRHVVDNDSGHYQCRASNGDSVAESVPMNVIVLVPVANATISPGALAQPVRAGDPVTLRCSVQVGSAPVTFTWLRNGSEVARGPLLELGDVHVGHSGTYQCVATNQLGQDGHRVFRALSPELALTVTPRAHWDTAVAVNIGRSLLFLVLLLGVIGGCHWWQRLAARKPQDSAPTGVPRPCPPSASTSDQRAAAGTLRGTAGPRCHLRECDVTLGGNWGSLGGIESPQRSLTALHSTPGPPHSPSQCRGLGTGPFCLFLDSKGSVWIKAEEMGLVCSALPAQLGKEEGPAQGAEQILVGFA